MKDNWKRGSGIYDAAVVFAGASLLTGIICYPGIYFKEGKRRHTLVTLNDTNQFNASIKSREVQVQIHEL